MSVGTYQMEWIRCPTPIPNRSTDQLDGLSDFVVAEVPLASEQRRLWRVPVVVPHQLEVPLESLPGTKKKRSNNNTTT